MLRIRCQKKKRKKKKILTEPTESESVVASKETPSKDMAKDDKLGTSDSTPGCEASAATGEIPDKDGESEEEEEGEQEIIDLEEEELRGDDVGGDVNLGAGEWEGAARHSSLKHWSCRVEGRRHPMRSHLFLRMTLMKMLIAVTQMAESKK